MSLLGVWITRFARTAESIQLIGFIPLFLLVFAGGAMIPLEFLAERFAQVARFTPLAPLVDLYRAAYFGADFFGGRVIQAPPLDRLELWAAALPSLGVSLAWVLVLCHLVRSVPWTARRT
jgi:ABC-2 type transport system permease protein